MTQLTTRTLGSNELVVSNSLCGGAYQLENISAPNDDVYSGSFEFTSGKDFQ